MVSESVERLIPYGLEAFDEHGLSKGNPDIVYDKVSASEVLQLEIRRLIDGRGVFCKASVQLRSGLGI